MAQTTRLASFGPFLIVAATRVLYLIIYTYNKRYLVQKNTKEKKNTHLWPKRRETRRLGLLLSSSPPTLRIS
jgi:hypothetical protein